LKVSIRRHRAPTAHSTVPLVAVRAAAVIGILLCAACGANDSPVRHGDSASPAGASTSGASAQTSRPSLTPPPNPPSGPADSPSMPGSLPSPRSSSTPIPLGPLLRVSPVSGGTGTTVMLVATNCPPPPSGLQASLTTNLTSDAHLSRFDRHQASAEIATASYRVAAADVPGRGRFTLPCGGPSGDAVGQFEVTSP
jgi:hypothetical protein